MKKQILVVLLVMFFISSVYSITADEVLDNAIDYIGGEKVLKTYHNHYIEKYIINHSTLIETKNLNQKLYFQKPNKLRIENYNYTALNEVYIYRDNKGWIDSYGEVIEIDDNYSTKEIWLNSLDYLIELKKKDISVVDDTSNYIITYVSKYGIIYNYYFNMSDYSLEKVGFLVNEKSIQIYFSDYKIINGTEIKYSYSRIVYVDGVKIMEEKIIKVELNKKFDEDLFKKPKEE